MPVGELLLLEISVKNQVMNYIKLYIIQIPIVLTQYIPLYCPVVILLYSSTSPGTVHLCNIVVFQYLPLYCPPLLYCCIQVLPMVVALL